jgi:plastocyanin
VGVACSGSEPTPAQGAQPIVVTVGDNVFSPNSTVVAVGTQVTWQWQGTLQHSVIFDNNDPGSTLQASGTFRRTFAAAGSHTYHCEIHGNAGMTGVVTVNSSGGGEPPPPPGPYPARR